ncbi:MAG TPA: hypothetical protein VGV09_11245 [Steroidobacteraceae bacterium]|nr:hypothetical protein [Steroidobacteraceae bacterium]
MKGFVASAITIAMLSTAPAMAGPFDGNWIGQIPPAGPCRGVAMMTITVSGDSVSGLMHNNPNNIRAFKGTIDADGNATFTTQSGRPGTIKFTTDHFDANWNSGDCQRHSLGDRAPDATQVAAMITRRNQAQASYDELTARAATGDRSVDFTVLRSNFPYTRQWDTYTRNIAPILEQAKIAANGKDCSTALEKLDEVLKADYTMIAAHRLRADCLKGEPARIESRVADALLRSLTRGGDGRSEDSAYPVMTLHEEQDVLADKHIVLKTRDVEVRGSNGRYYDVVHGISLAYGVRVQDVYFDVSAEVAGRSSARAAREAAPSVQQ